MSAGAAVLAPAPACPEPGIHPDVEAAAYHQWDAASNSRLSHLLRSPAHLRESVLNPKAATDAMALGSAAHALILEPATFASIYCIAGRCDGVTGKGAQCSNAGTVRRDGRWTCGVHDKDKGLPGDGLTVLSGDHWEKAHRMADAVRRHAAAAELLALAGDREVSVVWDDPETEVRCKGRPDHLAGSAGIVVDLKTTADASAEAFTRSIFNFGYHRQGAHYQDGLAHNGVQVAHHVILAVETTAPHAVAVYRLREDAIDAGRTQLRQLLAVYRDCAERNEWPGYPAEIQDISLPRWAWSSIESEEL